MKKQEQKQIVSVDEFDRTVSLYQLISPGAGRALSHLKLIVDAVHHSPESHSHKPISLLISGKMGKRTHGRAFLRALGLESINEIPAQLLQASASTIDQFFSPFLLCDCFLVSNIEVLRPSALKTLHEIITEGQFFGYDYVKQVRQVIPTIHPLVATTANESRLPKYLTENIGHIVRLDDYSDQQLELIVLQRLKYCQIDYEVEKVLWLVKEYGLKDLHKMIRLLKSSIVMMMADSRQIITVDDVKKVMAYS